MRTLICIMLLTCSGVCHAVTYNCALERRSPGEKKYTRIWSDKLNLKSGKGPQASVAVIKGSATVFLDSLTKNAAIPLREAFRPYDGMLVVGLRSDNGRLDINLGHVDISNEENMMPFDSLAWTLSNTKEIGLVNETQGLKLVCRRE